MQLFKAFRYYWLIVLFVACQSGGNSGKPAVLASADFSIKGMVCAVGCAKTIEKELAEMSGVISCKVNFEENTAHIEFDRAVLTSLDIQQHIEGMNEGQYKVKIVHEEAKESSTGTDPNSGGSSGGGSPVSVEEATFSFPQLLTYFMKHSV